MAQESDENLNVILLQLMCQKFITQITRSTPNSPWFLKIFSRLFFNLRREIRKICLVIKQEVAKKYPGYEQIAIGAFIFLRFFNTAIVVPESHGLLKSNSSELPF